MSLHARFFGLYTTPPRPRGLRLRGEKTLPAGKKPPGRPSARIRLPYPDEFPSSSPKPHAECLPLIVATQRHKRCQPPRHTCRTTLCQTVGGKAGKTQGGTADMADGKTAGRTAGRVDKTAAMARRETQKHAIRRDTRRQRDASKASETAGGQGHGQQ